MKYSLNGEQYEITRLVRIYKAQKGSHAIAGATIEIREELPNIPDGIAKGGDYLRLAADRFDEQAEMLFVALRDTLPGGTMDRLVGKLLMYKASHFVVSWEKEK